MTHSTSNSLNKDKVTIAILMQRLVLWLDEFPWRMEQAMAFHYEENNQAPLLACKVERSCNHQGRKDIEQHVASEGTIPKKTAATIVISNIPLAFSVHLSPLSHEISLTTWRLNGKLKPHYLNLVQQMRGNQYSISIDGSNNAGREKMNPVTVNISGVA